MNTIAPPPPKVPVPPKLRPLAIATGFLGGIVVNAAVLGFGWKVYSRNTVFVPYGADVAGSDFPKDFATDAAKKFNPYTNSPVLADCAVRIVPLSKLKSQKQEEMTRDFCRGVWSGLGYAYQRRYLEKKYRDLPGREDNVWEREELGRAEYEVGTKITDHFEVVEKTPEKITVRCGDSPLTQQPRPSDGLFTMEVQKDEKNGLAVFALKSIFVNTLEEGKNAGTLPWYIQWAHREYTKAMMETSVRKMLK